jgi:hypothetical protein
MKRRKLWVVLGLLLLVAGVAFAGRKLLKRARPAINALADEVSDGPRVAKPLTAAEVIYDSGLGKDWDDWGWGPHELNRGVPAKIVFKDYGGWLLHHPDLAWRYGGLAFRFKAPPAWGNFLQVGLRVAGKPEDAFPVVAVRPRHVAAVGGGWNEVLVDWKELNPERFPFDRVIISSRTAVGPEWAELDKVVLLEAQAQDTQQGALRVLCEGESHPISELIYGASADYWKSGQAAKRIGGNPLSRAHWELGTWNTGHDWFFENTGQDYNLLQILEKAARDKRKIAMVVPMLGWVSKDKTSVGFPRAKFGPQRKYDPHRPEAGDGYGVDDKPLRPIDPRETSVEAPPELIASWVKKARAQEAAVGSRSIDMFILDNEPTLWNVTHRDVHPDPIGYDELLDRTIRYAKAIREAAPDVLIAGPAEWGYVGYEYSAVDREAGPARPDRRAHGDMQLVAWYLKKLAEYEKTNGVRLLDVFDLHYYPQSDGLYGGNARTDPTTAELRVRATRSLWDPDYVDESWIKEKLQLLPRMQKWVRENYPGLKLSLGEWSFGAQAHISGGLATAEALGRFGQQGLYSAFLWDNLDEGTPGYWAFRAYRDFDGQGARFQDISVPTREMADVSLFASRNPEKTKLVLVVVNRSQSIKVSAKIALDRCGRPQSTRLFSFTESSKGLTPGSSQLQPDAVSIALEPFSFSVLEIALEK